MNIYFNCFIWTKTKQKIRVIKHLEILMMVRGVGLQEEMDESILNHCQGGQHVQRSKKNSTRPGCLVINQTSCTHFALDPSQLSQQGVGTDERLRLRASRAIVWAASYGRNQPTCVPERHWCVSPELMMLPSNIPVKLPVWQPVRLLIHWCFNGPVPPSPGYVWCEWAD